MSLFKKQIVLFFFLISFLIGSLPVYNYFHNPKATTLKKLFSADILVSYKNFIFYRFFNRSLNNNKVIAGKSGFLFLGNKYNYLLSNSQNLIPFSKKPIDSWTKNLKELQHWYEKQGVKFVITVVPNKHTVYSEYLPNWMFIKNHNLVDRAIISAKEEGINLLDLRPVFTAKKLEEEELLYYKTDSHWNLVGASIGFRMLIKYIGEHFSINSAIPEYSILKKDVQGLGSARLLKIAKQLPLTTDSRQIFKFKNKIETCHAGISKDLLEFGKCKKSNKVVGIHHGAHYFINKTTSNKQKILLLGDSFVDSQTQLLSQTFNTVWRIHYNEVEMKELKSFVRKNKPTIVIYQLVERNVYNNRFLN